MRPTTTTKTAAALLAIPLLAAPALAQPEVPDGFTIRRIAPLLDGVRPQLSAILDPSGFGIGVLTAVVQPSGAGASGVGTIRLIQPSGTIRVLGSLARTPLGSRTIRVRLADGEPGLGLIHVVFSAYPDSQRPIGMVYATLGLDGTFVERFERRQSDVDGEIVSDFEFTDASPSFPGGFVLLDISGPPTELAYLEGDFDLQVASTNSVPEGRTDTDVQGFRRDVTGRYGGGILVADTDDNDRVTTIYELTDVLEGGAYRAVYPPISWNNRRYGDLDIAQSGAFGGIIYITETLTDEIQTVDPDGTHTTWATGFSGIDALSISPDGQSMYVADLSGVWLVRPSGDEPGPVVLTTDPSTPTGSTLSGGAIGSLRIIFNEPVEFVDAHVSITNAAGEAVVFDASGSGSQFMLIGLATPLDGDTYTVTISDSVRSVATGEQLDGDGDGVAGGDAELVFTHACRADFDGDGELTIFDFLAFQTAFDAGCP